MKRVYVEDLWPGDVYKPYENGPMRRIVSIDYVRGLPSLGIECQARLTGDGFDVYMYMTDVVWRLP